MVGSPPPPWTVPATDDFLQLVPLSVNSLRFRFTTIWRMSSFTPPKTSGISALVETWPVSGLRFSGAWTTTLPRSNGPATAGVMTTIESGAPL